MDSQQPTADANPTGRSPVCVRRLRLCRYCPHDRIRHRGRLTGAQGFSLAIGSDDALVYAAPRMVPWRSAGSHHAPSLAALALLTATVNARML